jgi:uncharacterized glyoxalase superfamily protein PhnB
MSKLPMVIIYVADQERSRSFYETVLEKKPLLHVPGMTEFKLTNDFLLGIMPESGIVKILGNKMPDPRTGNGIPRCELYLLVNDPERSLQQAIRSGAKEISPAELRSWGDIVAYCSDPDGHIIAFAK